MRTQAVPLEEFLKLLLTRRARMDQLAEKTRNQHATILCRSVLDDIDVKPTGSGEILQCETSARYQPSNPVK